MTYSIEEWLGIAAGDRRVLAWRSQVEARESIASHGAYISVVDELETPPPGGEFENVPFAVKDNVDVAGLPTTAGSPLFANDVPEADAGVVSVLRAAGAVVVGKTNMHELAFGVSGNNATYGPVRNPWDPERTAGGSSGGSALAVALGTVPFSVGTDTGGSVTIPASFCGVTGFRPSTGRYPGDGVVNLSSSRDMIGLHARDVAGIRAVDRLITGCSPEPEPEPIELDRLTLGMVRSRYQNLAREVEPVVRAALDQLAAAGVELVQLDIPGDIGIAESAGLDLVFYETERLLAARAARVAGRDAQFTFSDVLGHIASPDVKALAEAIVGGSVPAAGYERARRGRWQLRRAYSAAFAAAGVDALIAPTVHVLPPMLGDDETTELSGEAVPLFSTVIRNPGPGTVAGVPMLSLPAGKTDGGLPVGMCVEGRFFDDDRLLRIAETIEAVLRTGKLWLTNYGEKGPDGERGGFQRHRGSDQASHPDPARGA